jgi:hypothetical protein
MLGLFKAGSLAKATLNGLPIERHTHHRPMLHDVEGVLAEPTVFAEIDGKCAVADNRVQWCTEAIDVEAVGGDCLPRKFTPGAETTDIAYKAEFLARRNLMPDARPYYWIDPLKIARVGNCHAPRALKLETQFAQIDGKRTGQAQR